MDETNDQCEACVSVTVDGTKNWVKGRILPRPDKLVMLEDGTVLVLPNDRIRSTAKTPTRREYYVNGTYWSGVPTIDIPCDFCHRQFMDHDPRTHACPVPPEQSQIVVGDSDFARMQAQTPVCTKCGQIDVRIPAMGIYHLCPQ